MNQRIPEDEMEYLRYLHRLKRREQKRRKVMLARMVAGLVLLLAVVLCGGLIRLGIKAVSGMEKKKQTAQEKATPEPTRSLAEFNVPAGDEELAQSLLDLMEEYPQAETILMNLYAYPKEILELAVSNQETLDFAADYPRHKLDQEASGELTQEEVASGIPLLQQWDKRWGYTAYGDNIIAIDGCGPTCLSMVCAGLLQDASLSPDAIAEFSIENNYYTSESGSSWSLMSSGAQSLGLTVHAISLSEQDIRKQLKKGHPVICSMKPGDFTTTGHFIVLTGLTQEGTLEVNDPNSISRSQQDWDIEVILDQAKAVWAYSV